MAELGLFTPRNPVTAATTAEAVARGLAADAAAPDACQGIVPVEDLPPELEGKGYVRAFACYEAKGKPPYANRFQALICTTVVFSKGRWVDCDRGAIVSKTAAGRLVLVESPCLLGYGRPSYRTLDLEGNELCVTVPADPNPRDPIPASTPVGFAPGAGLPFGVPRLPGGARGLGGLPITVSGVNVGDILKLLDGSGASVDLSGVLRVLAALVVQGGNIRGSLDQLAPELGAVLDPQLGGLARALESLVPGVGTRLSQALAAHGDKTAEASANATAFALGAIPPAVGPAFQALVEAAGTTLPHLGDIYKNAVDSLMGKILDLFRDDIEAHAPVTPANVDKVAAAALRSALTAGSVAQLSGMALELLHPLKNLGVQQAIGVLATFAGFEEIAKPFFGATLRYGIGLPAEHRAAAHFRTVLPSLEGVRELAAIGLVPLEKYRQRLELAGYPEPYPAAFTDTVYTPPAARFLAQLLEGSEADRPWLARQFRRLGFSPENTERAVRAADLKTTAPGRGRVVSTLLAEYQKGHIAEDTLDAGFSGAGLSVTHRAYYKRVAQLERRGYRMELVAGEVLAAYRDDLLGPESVRQQLAGLGFAGDEVNARLVAADVRRGRTQVAAEVRGLEAEIRALKARGLANATRQLRAGFLSLGRFLLVGEGIGYTRAYLQNVADLAFLEGPPRSATGEPAIGRGALEDTRARIAELLTQEVQAKRAERLATVVSLRTLGVPQDLASTLVELAEAIAGPASRSGDFGMPAGAEVGGAFATIAQAVTGGLGTVRRPAELVAEVLKALGLPLHDRATLARLIRDLRELFRV